MSWMNFGLTKIDCFSLYLVWWGFWKKFMSSTTVKVFSWLKFSWICSSYFQKLAGAPKSKGLHSSDSVNRKHYNILLFQFMLSLQYSGLPTVRNQKKKNIYTNHIGVIRKLMHGVLVFKKGAIATESISRITFCYRGPGERYGTPYWWTYRGSRRPRQ